MSIIDQRAIAQARIDVVNTMLNTCNIWRGTRGKDSVGAPKQMSFVKLYSDVAIGLEPQQYGAPSDRSLVQGLEGSFSYKARLPHAQDVLPGDRIEIDGIFYHVRALMAKHAMSIQRVATIARVL